MKVLFLLPTANWGGPEQFVLSLCKHWNGPVHGQSVAILTSYINSKIVDELGRYADVYLGTGDLENDCRVVREAARNCDMIISNGITNLRTVCAGLNKPVLCVSHCSGTWKEQTEMVHKEATGAHFHAGVSETACSAFPDGCDAVAVPAGVDPERIFPMDEGMVIRRAWGIGIRDKVALFLGRMFPEKSPDRMIELAIRLPDEWKVLMVGDGPCRNDLMREAIVRGCKENMIFVNATNDVGNCYSIADATVIPSDSEAFPLVYFESALYGIPVVMMRNTFTDELAERHGIMAEVVDHADELADAVERSQSLDMSIISDIVECRYTARLMAYRWGTFVLGLCSLWMDLQSNISPRVVIQEGHHDENGEMALGGGRVGGESAAC